MARGKNTRADLREKPLDEECYRAYTTTQVYGGGAMSEKYLVSLQDLHDWYFHALPFGESEKLNKWFEDREFHDE